LVGCNTVSSQPSTSATQIPASAFLLGSNVFPSGWKFESSEDGIIVAGRDFYLPKAYGHSFQEIYRRPNDNEASKKFKVYLEGEFNVSGTHQPAQPFSLPPEITFKSKIADEYYFACGIDVIPQCKMLARYQNFFVFLYFDLSTKNELGGLTYTEIQRVLEALEAKASDLLSDSNNITPTK
jgi:hypothetical protein